MSPLAPLYKLEPIRATVWVNDTPVDFVSLDIQQAYYDHHRFQLKLDYHVLEKTFMDTPEQHISLIGEKLVVEFQLGENLASEYAFSGVVTSVRMQGEEGKHGYIVLEGASPTILLERGKLTTAYANTSLKSLFSELVQDVRSDLITTVNEPSFQGRIPFALQYEETDFEFLRRMAVRYGEPFFYAGTRLVWGKHKEQPAQILTYDVDLTSFELGTRLLANEFAYTHYRYQEDGTLDAPASREVENANRYVQQASRQAGRSLTFGKKPVLPLDVPAESQEELDRQVKVRRGRIASETAYLTATCKTCKAFIGTIVEVRLPESMGGTTDLGLYRVVRAHHYFDQNSCYKCEFEAVPAQLGSVPVPAIPLSIAQPLRAVVVDNADPDGMGRIRVRLPWQDRNIKYWLQVMTPDAGSSDTVAKNRGFVFVPEVGDSVLLDFEYGDPNRPFVMGSLFHGKNASGGGKDNSIKSIITKSGHTIELNDDEKGEWGITIRDKNSNTIHLDTKGKSIAISAPEKMTLHAKNMDIIVDESMACTVGKNMDVTVSEKQSVSAKKIAVGTEMLETNIKDDKTTNIGGKLSCSAQKVEQTTSGNYSISSGANVEIKGSKEVKLT